jgi:hypothetical protein
MARAFTFFQPGICTMLPLLLLFGACTKYSLDERQKLAGNTAASANLSYSEWKTSFFTHVIYYRPGPTNALSIYIEGDGLAYLTPTRLSPNPTPTLPIGLMLAASDPSNHVLYVARPCQYVSLSKEPQCTRKYWSSHRFAEEVIASYNEILDSLAERIPNVSFHLVGYSGGGAVAVLLGARRTDITSIRTVAGYLDHVALNKLVNVAPLEGSLDPMQIAASLKGVAQVHYSGADDPVIPAWVGKNFADKVGDPMCAKWEVIDHVGHGSGWKQFWRGSGYVIPQC